MRSTDLAAGLFLFLVGAITMLAVIPAQISGHSDYGLPPDFFPRILIWMLIGMSALLVAHRLLAAAIRRTSPGKSAGGAPMGAGEWLFISAVAVFFLAVFLVMTHAGFIPAGVIVIAAVAAIMGGLKGRLIRILILAIAAPPAIFYAFKHLFLVFLPS